MWGGHTGAAEGQEGDPSQWVLGGKKTLKAELCVLAMLLPHGEIKGLKLHHVHQERCVSLLIRDVSSSNVLSHIFLQDRIACACVLSVLAVVSALLL